ncbi:hypothetical protein CRP_097 [Candidatus Carsonella ruddii PV]|uniref:Uncharacterized protein n=1 Tax=Carsonella ruddii (strain PV) TaxID=387662 RepID=Q05FP3_CARRP|nr:hypothetical protein [Candidatus Carsonella ruddii]BAF35128.1 hypothetical protein CRP_097 [Candidatus Carsonella ruddii PV]
MKIYILVYSLFKIKINIKNKNKKKKKIIIIIKKNKFIKYFKIKNSFFISNLIKKKKVINEIIILKHYCKNKLLLHCFKHFFEKHHNSYIEVKINDLF